MDTRGEPDTFAMDRHEVWDVALKVAWQMRKTSMPGSVWLLMLLDT